MSKNIILSSLKESFKSIWRNKLLFLLLFILQISFFAVFSAISLNYMSKIVEHENSIFDYLSRQKLDETSAAQNILQQKNVLGDDPLSIARNLKEIVRNFRIYLLYTFALLIFFISVSWTITNKIIHRSGLRQLVRHFCKIFIVLLLYLGLIFYFFFSLVNISFAEIGAGAAKLFAKYIPLLIFSIVLVYFMFITLSLLNSTSLKNILQKTLSIGIKKMHYILSVYFIIISLFILAIAAALLFNFEENLFVMTLSILLIILSFIFGRIFMANVVEKLDREF